jgi:hypothetical protein
VKFALDHSNDPRARSAQSFDVAAVVAVVVISSVVAIRDEVR